MFVDNDRLSNGDLVIVHSRRASWLRALISYAASCFFSIALELDALPLKPDFDGLLWKHFEIGLNNEQISQYVNIYWLLVAKESIPYSKVKLPRNA